MESIRGLASRSNEAAWIENTRMLGFKKYFKVKHAKSLRDSAAE